MWFLLAQQNEIIQTYSAWGIAAVALVLLIGRSDKIIPILKSLKDKKEDSGEVEEPEEDQQQNIGEEQQLILDCRALMRLERRAMRYHNPLFIAAVKECKAQFMIQHPTPTPPTDKEEKQQGGDS